MGFYSNVVYLNTAQQAYGSVGIQYCQPQATWHVGKGTIRRYTLSQALTSFIHLIDKLDTLSFYCPSYSPVMIIIKETMVAKMQRPEYKPTRVKQQKVYDKRTQEREKEGTKTDGQTESA